MKKAFLLSGIVLLVIVAAFIVRRSFFGAQSVVPPAIESTFGASPFGASQNASSQVNEINQQEPSAVSSATTSYPSIILGTTQSAPSQAYNPVQNCLSSNILESDACISAMAAEDNNGSLCSYSSNSYAVAQCLQNVAHPGSDTVDMSLIKASSVGTETPVTSSPLLSPSPSPSVLSTIESLPAVQNAQFTLEAFIKRTQTTVPLALFSFSNYQVRPGSPIVAQGAGFSASNNTVHIGTYSVSGLASSDGMTMAFTLPSTIPVGTYDAWVTNSRGSSQNPEQPIRIIITNTPAPRPLVTGITPANPSVDDTVTLTGEHLSGALGVYTSLGPLPGIASTDTSITFKIADLPVVSKIRDLATVKGRVLQVFVVVPTPQGYNRDMFTFNVQF